MFNNLTKIAVVFLVMICFLMLGAFYLRYSISNKLQMFGDKLAVPSKHEDIAALLLDLNSIDNDYQEAVIDGDTLKFNAYRAGLSTVFGKLDKIVDGYILDTTLQLLTNEQVLKRAVAGKVELSSKVLRMKKDFDSLLLNTEQNIKKPIAEDAYEWKVAPSFKTVTVTDTLLKDPKPNKVKKKNFFSRLKDAVLNKPHKDSVESVLIIKQKESLLQNRTKGGTSVKYASIAPTLLNKLKIDHVNLSAYQQKLVLSNLALITELREVITNMSTYYNEYWQIRQKEYLKQHAATTLILDRFNMFIMGLAVVFLILLFFYIGKVGSAEKRYKMENSRSVQLAEERSEMLARMSHEIRNPLMAITGFIDLMQEDELGAKHRKMIDSIHVASEMLVNTVNDILDITKFQHDQSKMIEIRPFTPFDEIFGVVDTMQFAAKKKNIALHFEFSGAEDKLVKGDPFRLKQVLLNLLNNAIKFTDEGEIRVKARLEERLHRKYQLTVEVSDTGKGIKREFQNKLFSKYFQAHDSAERGGSGLGLYICKQLLQLQGGDIQLHSDGEDSGSTFIFTVPYTT